jgi:hypothetical protein
MRNKRLFFLLFISVLSGTVIAQVSEKEANLKAAFIYNFTKYIDWGEYDAGNVFTIGVLGNAQITTALKEIAENNTVNGKPIVVRSLENPSEASGCDILFISKSCDFTLDKILPHVDKGVLTISEQPGYAEQGTAFNFIIIKNRLKFEANLNAISSAGLKAGSQLLKLAKIVE